MPFHRAFLKKLPKVDSNGSITVQLQPAQEQVDTLYNQLAQNELSKAAANPLYFAQKYLVDLEGFKKNRNGRLRKNLFRYAVISQDTAFPQKYWDVGMPVKGTGALIAYVDFEKGEVLIK